MRWVAVAVLVVLLVLAIVFLLPSGDEPEPERRPDDGKTGIPDAPPVVEPDEVVATPGNLDPGPGSIIVAVTFRKEPAIARVFLRDLRHAQLSIRDGLIPPWNPDPPLRETLTDEKGEARFEDLPLGSYEVTARGEKGVGWERAFCRDGRPGTRVRIDLIGGTAALAGRAFHMDGRIFKGMAFAYVGRRMTPQVTLDEEGRFVIPGLPPGKVTLTLLSPGRFRTAFAGIPVPHAGEEVFCLDEDLETSKGRVIADDDDAPIPGAEIGFSASAGKRGPSPMDPPARSVAGVTTSDENGRFKASLFEGQGYFWVEARGFETTQHHSRNGDEKIVIRMKRRGTISVLVVEKATGKPLEGLSVHAWNWHSFGLSDWPDTTDENGRAEGRAGPGRGMIYVLGDGWASAELGREHESLYVELDQGERVEVRREVIPSGRAVGVVHEADGTPAAGVQVHARTAPDWKGFRSHTVSAMTDGAGRFETRDLVPGAPYVFHAGRPGEPPVVTDQFEAESGRAIEVEIKLVSTRWLPVLIVDAETGDPIPAVGVRARMANGYWVPATKTGADGRARLGPMPAGDLGLLLSHPDYTNNMKRDRRPVSDPGPKPGEIRIELARLFAVSGRFVAEGEFPGGVATIHPVGDEGNGLGLAGGRFVREDRKFRMTGLTPGKYDLLLKDGTGRVPKVLGRWTVTVPDEDVELTFDPAFAGPVPLVITVLGPDNQATTGALFLWTGDKPRPWHAWFKEGKATCPPAELGTVIHLEVLGAKKLTGEPVGGVLLGSLTVSEVPIVVRLPGARTVSGRVLDPTGKPVANVEVEAQRVLPPSFGKRESLRFRLPAGRSGSDGNFTIEGLGEGSYQLLANAPSGYATPTPHPVTAGDSGVVFRLNAGAVVSGTVRGKDGPADNARVWWKDSRDRWANTTADHQGNFRLVALAGSEVTLLAVPPGKSTSDSKHPPTIVRAGTTDVTLSIDPWSIPGVVTLRPDRPRCR